MEDVGISTIFTIESIGLRITDTIINTWIVMFLLILFALLIRKGLSKVPGRMQLMAELIVQGTQWLVDNTMGEDKRNYAPYVMTLSLFLVVANLSSLIALRQPTADLNTTFALALMTFILIHYQGFKSKGGLGYIKTFFEPLAFMFPMNVISEIALPVSLSFRLFGNMLGSVIIMALLYSFAPIIIPAIGHVYFDIFVGLIQAFIFVMLTITFIAMKSE